MATEVKAPGEYNKLLGPKIFLGGAIDQGKAQDWQSRVVRGLEGIDCLVLNPRRDDWDADWEQSIDNPEFRRQVEWELKGQEDADLNLYVLLDDSKGPITMLEIGLFAKKDAVLCIEDNFYRRGNLEIVAERYNIPIYRKLDDMLKDLHKALAKKEA